MSDQRMHRVEALFLEASELPPNEREDLLSRASQDDPEMASEVSSLLAFDHPEDGFLRTPIVRSEDDAAETDTEEEAHRLIGKQIGRYRILRLIASGGMGAVYEAEQDHPQRIVALKVMRRGIASRSASRRFEHESQILARLHHPGIAQVYDVGMHDDGFGGVPYFVMEYIRNAHAITDFARSADLGTRKRLELFITVCDAVQHGHQKGIIHRDLKPGNILVDSSGQTKVIDFGVARATDSDIAVTTMQTDVGQLIGTLQYMSPEQVEADPHDLDVRSDVYSLGVVLYKLLCGSLPYDVSGVRIYEATRIIREQSPTRPSTVDRALRGDLETLVLKALEKDRERRYQSAADLAADIQRYLSHRPIMARPASATYQIRTFARRNKALVGGITATVVVLVAGFIGVTAMFLRARTAEVGAEQRASELKQVVDFQQAQLADLDAMKMGEGLRSAIMAKRRAALELEFDAMDESRIQRDLDTLDLSLKGVNFTNVALESLNQNIFEPALQEIDQRFGDQPLVQAQLLQSVAGILRGLEMPDRALAPQERALEIRRRELTDAHRDTIESLRQTSAVYEALGRFEEAERMARLAVQNARRELGIEDRLTLITIKRLGVFLFTLAEFDESEQCYREVMEIGTRVLGEKDPLVLSAMGNLAYALAAHEKYAEAEVLFRESLRLREEVHGSDHLGTLWSTHMLGAMLRHRGRLEEAAPYVRRSMEGYERVLGERHSRTLDAKLQMVALLREMYELDGDVRKLEAARELAVKQTQDAQQAIAHMRPHAAEWALLNYARVLILLEQFELAEAQLLEAEALLADTSVPIKNDEEFTRYTRAVSEAYVELYDAWHATEHDAGHDIKAAEWRARLVELDSS